LSRASLTHLPVLSSSLAQRTLDSLTEQQMLPASCRQTTTAGDLPASQSICRRQHSMVLLQLRADFDLRTSTPSRHSLRLRFEHFLLVLSLQRLWKLPQCLGAQCSIVLMPVVSFLSSSSRHIDSSPATKPDEEVEAAFKVGGQARDTQQALQASDV
jgi:hypothetical protein